MKRRTFVLLSGAASGSLLVPLRPPFRWASGEKLPGRLTFEFDDRHRWSLWYREEGAAVPLLPPGAAGVLIGDRSVTLGDLEELTIQAGTPAAGESLVLRGRAAGLFVEATFLANLPGPVPRASITIRIYPDVDLPMVGGFAWGQFALDRLVPGPGDLVVQTDGAAPAIRRVAAAPGAEIRSTGLLALTRRNGSATRALAVVAAPGGAGTLEARTGDDGLSFRTSWTPPRPVSTGGDEETVTFCYDPLGDGTSALTAACAPGAGDRDYLAGRTPPAGLWVPDTPGGGDDLSDLLAFASGTLDPRFAPFVCFESGEAGPRGHRWRTDQIHAAGLSAAVAWDPLATTAPAPELRERARIATEDWGYDALMLVTAGARQAPAASGRTQVESLRAALADIHAGARPQTTLWSEDVVPQTGTLDVVRVGRPAAAGWSGVVAAAELAGRRTFYHRSRWLNDPGPVTLGDPLTLTEARTWLGLAGVWGAATLVTTDVLSLPDVQLDLVRRVLPPAPVSGHPLDATRLPDEEAPALRVGDAAAPLSDWEDVTQDHSGRNGESWYRARVTAPAAGGGGDRAALLVLGRIAGADETFVNDHLVGATGRFGRGDPADALVSRRYAVPADAVRWGSENDVTVRVSGGSAPGARVDGPPPSLWVARSAPDWWTALVINWEETGVTRSLALAELGLPPGRYHVYDIWNGIPLHGGDPLRVTLGAHDSAALAFRSRGEHPLVTGTSRHVVQGAVDLAGEHWDPKTRVLSGSARNLDGRPYAVTVATAGAAPLSLGGGRPGAIRPLDSEYVVLEWPGGERGDFDWALTLGSRGVRSPRPRPH
ncbi:MAG TPA: hypothetical protein VMC86_01490 [Gemmatimonadales bacterium]|nr:hypothetical protein [Gemmatimonadales bacterium]